MAEESVFVVNKSTFDGQLALPNKGMTYISLDILENEIIRNGFFMLRKDAELSFATKQLIPYVAIINDSKIFVQNRTSKQGEKRLHGRMSIGFGGHINVMHQKDMGSLEEEMLRELHEELIIPGEFSFKYLGIINDDTNDVGRVHLGIFFVMSPSNANIRVKETNKITGNRLCFDDLMCHYSNLETWSQLALDFLRKQ